MSEELGNQKLMIPYTLPTRRKLCYIPNQNTNSDLNTNYINSNDYFGDYRVSQDNLYFNATEHDNFNATDFDFNAIKFPDFNFNVTNISDSGFTGFPWNICQEPKAKKHLAFLHFKYFS